MYTLTPKQNRDVEYELIRPGKIRNENASMGDLLSRMWGHFGKPETILFEGFIYNIKDEKSGLDFLVSYGTSGPTFLAEKENLETLEPTILAFEEFLDNSKNVDCEIEIDTDFGIYLCGAKNGIPYDSEKYNNEKVDVFYGSSTGNQHFDDLILTLKKNLEINLNESDLSLRQIDIDECIFYLNAYVVAILKSKTYDGGMFALKMTITAINNLNKRTENTLIVGDIGGKIVEIVNLASYHQKRYSSSPEDLTKELRQW